ncbi:MAG: hypothetical protein WCF36_03200 [Candidatus Nanopelagicales bacterium]
MSVEDRLRTGLADSVVGRARPDVEGQLVALEQRAGRRRRNRVAAGVAVAAAVVAGVLWVPGVTGPLQSIQPSSGDTSLSVLETRVPITPGLTAMLDGELAHPGEVSLVARLAEVEPTAGIWQEAFLAETVDGRLCLWIIEEGLTYSRGSSNGCQPRSELLTSGVYLPWEAPGGPEGPDRLVILVPDGYTQVTAGGTAVPVADNAAILGPIGDGTVVFTGPGKPNRIIRLDPTFVTDYQGNIADTQENNARIALTDLAQAARAYRDANGTTEGFAAQFREREGEALFNQMKEITDAGATAALDDGRCLTVTFPNGDITEAPC